MTFVQDGAPAHAAKATQAWCKKTPAKCYRENRTGRKSHRSMPYVAATECDNKPRRACRIFSLRMHVLDKAINIFKKFHVEV